MEQKEKRGGLTIAVRKAKSPKPVETQGFWTLVPVAGLEPARHRWRWILSFLECLDFGVIPWSPTASKTIKKPSDINTFSHSEPKKPCTAGTIQKSPICLFF